MALAAAEAAAKDAVAAAEASKQTEVELAERMAAMEANLSALLLAQYLTLQHLHGCMVFQACHAKGCQGCFSKEVPTVSILNEMPVHAGETQACADAAAERIAALEEAAEAAMVEHEGVLAEAEVCCPNPNLKLKPEPNPNPSLHPKSHLQYTNLACYFHGLCLFRGCPRLKHVCKQLTCRLRMASQQVTLSHLPAGDAQRCPSRRAGRCRGRDDGADDPAD